MRIVVLPLLAVTLAGIVSIHPRTIASGRPLPTEIRPNDNDTPAGRLRSGTLHIRLVAGEGVWYPELGAAPGRAAYAFGEDASMLQNPGPMIRVSAGTEIRAVVRNAIAGGKALTVHGLHDRPGAPVPLVVASGDSAVVRFRASAPGTYFYWGTTRGARATIERFGEETQLVGALIVDPPGARPRDYVFVIGTESDSADIPPNRELVAAVVNGRAWPHLPEFTVREGNTVRMRWINASDRFHPMHLHGFYFDVQSRGTSSGDTLYDSLSRRKAVTELMAQGSTMAISWSPERPGNWLMHCHMAEHMSPHLRRGARGHAGNHALDAMSGIVTGWKVLPRQAAAATAAAERRPPRRIRVVARAGPAGHGAARTMGFVVTEDGAAESDTITIPGRPIVLTRDEPAEITVVNRLEEPTSIHWHGVELDSYYDGVAGWSGIGKRTSPQIAPGDSFVVRFTPPRAGTFIYHSHFEEARQLAAGMFGPIIVLAPGERFDPETDRVWMMAQLGPASDFRVVLNGWRSPEVALRRGTTYRIRLVNISPNIPLIVSVQRDSVPVHWRAVAKDGADLPPWQATMRPARQLIGVGEAYDFALTPSADDSLGIVVRGPFGPVRLRGVVRVR